MKTTNLPQMYANASEETKKLIESNMEIHNEIVADIRAKRGEANEDSPVAAKKPAAQKSAAKKPRSKPAAKSAKKHYFNFSPSICKPNPGYCETIIANATKSAGGVMYASIPIELLDLDRAYQRELGPHVQEIADHWDEFKCGVLCVGYRDGRFYIWDGQNRFEAAKRRGGIDRLHCMIQVGMTQEQEALAFAKQNERKKRLSSADLMRAEIVGKDPVAISVKKVCDKHNVDCAPNSNKSIGALKAADRAKRIVSAHGEAMLDDIFDVVQRLGWNAEQGGYSTIVLHSTRNVLLASADHKKTIQNMVGANAGRTLREAMVEARCNYPAIHNGTDALTKLWCDRLGGKF